MARPFKCRRVAFIPGVTYFKPAGIPLRALEEARLTVEEAEAIRLKDLESLEQKEGAEKMNVSRSTFQRILASARQKIADALLNGKAIRIEGGNFEMSPRLFRCVNNHDWKIPFKVAVEATTQLCPDCNMPSVESPMPAGFRRGSEKRGWGRGRHVR